MRKAGIASWTQEARTCVQFQMPIESRLVRAIEEVFEKVKKMREDVVYRSSRNASSPSSIHGI
jgi:hypothetical protein